MEHDFQVNKTENPLNGLVFGLPQSRDQGSRNAMRRPSIAIDSKNGKKSTELRDIRSILSKRYPEFLAMVQMYQKNAGLKMDQEFNGIIPVGDFKTCLKAFGNFLNSKVSYVCLIV